MSLTDYRTGQHWCGKHKVDFISKWINDGSHSKEIHVCPICLHLWILDIKYHVKKYMKRSKKISL